MLSYCQWRVKSEISSMYILPDAPVMHDFEMAFSCESSFDQIRFFTVIRAFKSQHFQKFCFDFVLFVSKGFPESLLFFCASRSCSEAQSNPLCAPCLFLSSFSLDGVQPDCNQATEQPSTSFENQFQKNREPPGAVKNLPQVF